MVKLKPCPFCGSNEIKLSIHDAGGWWDGGVTCPTCGIGFKDGLYGSGISIDDVEKLVTESWNRRYK